MSQRGRRIAGFAQTWPGKSRDWWLGVICTRNEFASLVGMSAGWVTKALDEGMPAVRSGRKGDAVEIDTAQAWPWLLERAEGRVGNRPESERDRLASEQADKVALENRVRRGELVEAAAVQSMASELVARLGSALDGLPGRLANELAGIHEPAEIRARLVDEIRTARNSYAEGLGRMADAAAGAGAGRAAGAGASAAKAKPQRVGGRKPRAAARKRGARAVPE